ncbi:MAG: phosphate signaling complex protein PhoU [Eggerthellaceae bacterium]|jgi:phosphate transport system protein
METRTEYVHQLGQLHGEIEAMGAHVGRLLDMARTAETADETPDAQATGKPRNALDIDRIERASSDLAQRERDIESLALRLLLLQQPVARDMREVSGALKAVTDLKRIGELSLDICRFEAGLAERGSCVPQRELEEMAAEVASMVAIAVASYCDGDLDKAQSAIGMEDEIDVHLHNLRDMLVRGIYEKRVSAVDGIDVLMIAKNYERIGDHAENLAYWTEYVEKGTRDGRPYII